MLCDRRGESKEPTSDRQAIRRQRGETQKARASMRLRGLRGQEQLTFVRVTEDANGVGKLTVPGQEVSHLFIGSMPSILSVGLEEGWEVISERANCNGRVLDHEVFIHKMVEGYVEASAADNTPSARALSAEGDTNSFVAIRVSVRIKAGGCRAVVGVELFGSIGPHFMHTIKNSLPH